MIAVLSGVELAIEDVFGHTFLHVRAPGHEARAYSLADPDGARQLAAGLVALVVGHGFWEDEEV
ncbi:MAG: hypothetical protein M3Q74_09760 [Pseudomonadota bacterium]|nr:hypothetical protein [Pseudomonadota bacterium]